jgi:hypothetical protein
MHRNREKSGFERKDKGGRPPSVVNFVTPHLLRLSFLELNSDPIV